MAEKKNVKTFKTQEKIKSSGSDQPYAWWRANSKAQLAAELLETANYLKVTQAYRWRQAGIYARLYGNMPLMSSLGGSSTVQKMTGALNLPLDRPTMNVVQSVIDTKVSRITQARPKPVFLTDNGDAAERKFAKQMNNFIGGEFYQTKAYELGALILRDAEVLGDGAVKIYRNLDNRVCLERRLVTELYVDPNEALYGNPRQLYELKLIDRAVLQEYYPEFKNLISKAEAGFPENGDQGKSVSDMVVVAEGWRLPSSKTSGDGRHSIVCSAGVIHDEEWKKPNFPFVFLSDSPRLYGFWGQGAAERLMGTQVEINKLLVTSAQSINLLGVPRILMEKGAKIAKAHFNNNIGSIVEYSGTAPIIMDGTSGLAEGIYAERQRLITYAYQAEGVSQMTASSEKPAGLNSGEAIRSFDNLSTDRMYTLSKRYSNWYQELAYQILDCAADIAEETGKYETVYPDKHGSHRIDLPKFKRMDDPFVIQCFDSSSLPKDPAGRLQKVTEMMQSGLISPQEGRRLLDFPDIEQVNKLAAAQEERIYTMLDAIVEDGKYTPPDPFLMGPDASLPTRIVCDYYNLFAEAKLPENRLKMLRDWFTQVQTLNQAAQPPPPPQGDPMAVPQAPPVSDQLPNLPKAG